MSTGMTKQTEHLTQMDSVIVHIYRFEESELALNTNRIPLVFMSTRMPNQTEYLTQTGLCLCSCVQA
jgi:hypothetical protein